MREKQRGIAQKNNLSKIQARLSGCAECAREGSLPISSVPSENRLS